jgi:hypothetical protein
MALLLTVFCLSYISLQYYEYTIFIISKHSEKHMIASRLADDIRPYKFVILH